MHLYMLTRGIKHDVDRFINELSSKYLPYKHHKIKDYQVQVGVRPMQLWEIVFPREHLQSMINTIRPQKDKNFKFNALMATFRKALNAKKIPNIYDIKGEKMLVYNNNVISYVIGNREDANDKDGNEIL